MQLLRTLPIGALLLSFAAPGLAVAQGFEGKIEQREILVSEYGLSELLYSEDEEEAAELSPDNVFSIPVERILALSGELGEEAVEITELTYYVTAGKMRVESASDMMPGHMIMDFESGVFQMVVPMQKMYMEITKEDMEELQEQYPDMSESDEPSAKPQIRSLGTSKEINGMRCEGFEIVKGETVSNVWVSSDLKDVVTAFQSFVDRMEVFGMEDEDDEELEVFELMKEHGFPVLEQTLNNFGWEMGYEISEIISVERSDVPADLFVIPSDYQRRSFMEMMGGLGGGN
ncbi:MAG TPA: DUF4412 domain-containing protein [Gemmatimonadota bacterium]|nr:DUF4412 domain-containing protein [Gemmatimonadota bacterium]